MCGEIPSMYDKTLTQVLECGNTHITYTWMEDTRRNGPALYKVWSVGKTGLRGHKLEL